MAITGLLFIAFLLAHMAGNLKMLINDHGAEFDAYSHWLRDFGYPAIPHGIFLWCFRIVLLAAVVLHFVAAVKVRARDARQTGGGRRYVVKRNMEKSFAARTMLWGGIIIVLFLIMHLLQYTAEVLKFGYASGVSHLPPHERVLAGFSEWWVVLIYAIAMAAVCFHIWHGFWSAFATLGANASAGSRRVLKLCAHIVALALYVGFMLPPVLILTKVIGQ